MEKLKPCPFCGYDNIRVIGKSREVRFDFRGMRIERRIYRAQCERCFAKGSTVSGFVRYGEGTSEQTIARLIIAAGEAWNRRVKEVEE